MKKIGIVSELNLKNVNYGNRLQAYALNYYLNSNTNLDAYSFIFSNPINKKITSNYITESIKKIIRFFIKKGAFKKINSGMFARRLYECNRFTKENTKIKYFRNYRKFKNQNYNYLIVGSDVVWGQFHNAVNRIKFLDFKGDSDYKKIAYAASFGKNWIPEENKSYINAQLKKFSSISVREKSAIEVLNSIGVNKVKHVCDPTLLLGKDYWKSIEKKVESVGTEKYVFVYLLGKNKKQREVIKEFAARKGYKIVDIPHANMKYDIVDEDFADISINDASPEEWIWLIDHAKYVFTDSFHGCMFSLMFQKKFAILKREFGLDLNIRMQDILQYLGEENKFVTTDSFISQVENLTWDYNSINKKLDKFENESKEFIDNSLNLK